MKKSVALALLVAGALLQSPLAAQQPSQPFVRDPKIPIDDDYTKKIKEYTTEPFFSSPLVDYLPASKTVPTPKAVLGDIAGAPGKLPYAEEVYQYMRMLEKAAPGRVKVVTIGKTEEGREMIAVAIASDAIMAKLDENRARLAKLADPRTINMDDAQAEALVAASTPIYYITGTIHSPETGAPTALMELAYRLAVDDHEYIKAIRNNLITLITPVIEVDGRDKMVDVYKWHLAHPGQNYPGLVYWGKYVAHDNNRDAMGATLKLTENVLNTWMQWHPQVLHDLHESVPYLYDNTVGDGPYNAWIDPILADEWEMIGWNNVSEMTKFGMPGVFTHGNFDTWSPGYLMFIAALHNGISRLYETFGNGGADTVVRELRPDEYARTWYKQNPPLPKAMWSQRNNNNYEQTGLLTSLHYFAGNGRLFLRNFYLKSKRSILKAKTEGPAAYVLPADDPRPGAQADLLRVLQKQGVEISRATGAFTVTVPGKRGPARQNPTTTDGDGRSASAGNASPGSASLLGEREAGGPNVGQDVQDRRDGQDARDRNTPPAPVSRTFPTGSYIVRMDQPYSRIADSLMDYQYWSPNDPQKTPYDDTGWTFPELYNVQAVRVADVKVLDAAMEKMTGAVRAKGRRHRHTGSVYVVNHNADIALATLRYKFKDASFEAAEEPFDAAGKKFNRGSFIIKNAAAGDLEKAAADLGLQIVAVSAAPSVKTHPVRAPRVAILHTWLSTQTEGWWRQAFDDAQVPYTYISTQQIANDAEPQREVRRHRLSAGRPRPRRDRQRHADVGQRAAVEEDRGDAEPRLRGSDRRHAPGPRLHRHRQPADVRAQGRAVPHGDGHRRSRRVDRLHAGALRRRAPAPAHRRQRRAIEDDRRDQPDRLRLHRQPRALVRQRADLQRLERVRRPRRTPPRARRWREPADRTRARPTIRTRRRGASASRSPRSRAPRRGRRCRSPTSSCATAST